MLIGFALMIVAVFLCCALLFRLSIYALPLLAAFLAGSADMTCHGLLYRWRDQTRAYMRMMVRPMWVTIPDGLSECTLMSATFGVVYQGRNNSYF